jgi:hypothetical protein
MRKPALPSVVGAVDYAHIVQASGKVSAAGGVPSALSINPADYVTFATGHGGGRPAAYLGRPDRRRG